VQTQVLFEDDNKKSKSNGKGYQQEQVQTQVLFEDDNKKSKSNGKGISKCKCRRRSSSRMTTRKTRAKTETRTLLAVESKEKSG
jgi:hypothetical protein